MIALDTNVLVYAHVESFAKHADARAVLLQLARQGSPWGVPAPCVSEFLRVVTHRRVLKPPLTMEQAVEALDVLFELPSASIVLPGESHWQYLRDACLAMDARGNLAFDASIASLCEEAGVVTLITEDRDLQSFRGLSAMRCAEFLAK